MKQTEALKMAIEVMTERGWHADKRCNDLITACKEALQSQEQENEASSLREPVAWIIQSERIDGTSSEPYAMMGKYKYVRDACDFGDPIPLYTHPKEWQELSDDEINKLYADWERGQTDYSNYARAILAKAKEKNT